MVYYRHLGNEVFDDSFEVVLSDFHDPPNLSESQVGNSNTTLNTIGGNLLALYNSINQGCPD